MFYDYSRFLGCKVVWNQSGNRIAFLELYSLYTALYVC